MKKIALFCVICLLLTAIPLAVSAGEVSVAVTDVANDIVTISGTAPVDTIISILILNPGKALGNISASGTVQYMGAAYSQNGEFSCPVKMNTTGGMEGAFTVIVNIDGELAYLDENFIFYSNETKLSYVTALKGNNAEQLLAVETNGLPKLENIFTTYSLSGHELYKEAKLADVAKVICAQSSRTEIATPADVTAFLNNALVLNAFDNKSSKVYASKQLKYTDVWAADNSGAINELYSDRFVTELSDDGKNAVISAVTSADYTDAQFGAVFDVFEESMLFNLIMNNVAMGSGHIEALVLTDFNAEYENAGFTTSLLSSITNATEKTYKLNSLLDCNATSLYALATQFNSIMGAAYSSGNGGGSGSGGFGGGSGGGMGGGGTKVNAESGSAFVDTVQPSPTPDVSLDAPTPAGNYPFLDMEDSVWANEAVEYLYTEGIVSGRSETQFEPTQSVTRAELIKMITEAFDAAETTGSITFSDVKDTDWFSPYIKRAAAAGIVLGSDGAFYPNSSVTREDAALMIYRTLSLESKGDLSAFTDAEHISGYAKEAIAAMVSGGYIRGMGDGTFAPAQTLTRAQAAQLIYNAIIKGGAAS